jgi:hypothetical protein
MASKPRRRRSVSSAHPPDDAWSSSDSEDEALFSSLPSSVSVLIELFNCSSSRMLTSCSHQADLPSSSNPQDPTLSSYSSLFHPQPSSTPITAVNPLLSTNFNIASNGTPILARLNSSLSVLTLPAPHTNPIFGSVTTPPIWSQAATQPSHVNSVSPILMFPHGNLNQTFLSHSDQVLKISL